MNGKQYASVLALVIVSGLIGGAISIWLLMPRLVLAQVDPPRVTETQEFRLVDSQGNSLARWDTNNSSTNIIFIREDGLGTFLGVCFGKP